MTCRRRSLTITKVLVRRGRLALQNGSSPSGAPTPDPPAGSEEDASCDSRATRFARGFRTARRVERRLRHPRRWKYREGTPGEPVAAAETQATLKRDRPTPARTFPAGSGIGRPVARLTDSGGDPSFDSRGGRFAGDSRLARLVDRRLRHRGRWKSRDGTPGEPVAAAETLAPLGRDRPTPARTFPAGPGIGRPVAQLTDSGETRRSTPEAGASRQASDSPGASIAVSGVEADGSTVTVLRREPLAAAESQATLGRDRPPPARSLTAGSGVGRPVAQLTDSGRDPTFDSRCGRLAGGFRLARRVDRRFRHRGRWKSRDGTPGEPLAAAETQATLGRDRPTPARSLTAGSGVGRPVAQLTDPG